MASTLARMLCRSRSRSSSNKPRRWQTFATDVLIILNSNAHAPCRRNVASSISCSSPRLGDASIRQVAAHAHTTHVTRVAPSPGTALGGTPDHTPLDPASNQHSASGSGTPIPETGYEASRFAQINSASERAPGHDEGFGASDDPSEQRLECAVITEVN